MRYLHSENIPKLTDFSDDVMDTYGTYFDANRGWLDIRLSDALDIAMEMTHAFILAGPVEKTKRA